jgi:hypothetical protein
MFFWGRGYNDAPDSSEPRLAHIGLKLCQVSLGWRHGLALAGNASSTRCLRTCFLFIDEASGLPFTVFACSSTPL